MKKYIWMPIAFFCVGMAFYIYYGITWNSWTDNLPNMGVYVIICCGLYAALKKKDALAQEREQLNDNEK